MATADELIEQAKNANSAAELDAVAAQAEDRVTVTAAVDARRAELAQSQPAAQRSGGAAAQGTQQRQIIERTVVREVTEPPLGPNATTTPPEEHYFLASDGETKINAWGEEIGSKEAKQRAASRGLPQ